MLPYYGFVKPEKKQQTNNNNNRKSWKVDSPTYIIQVIDNKDVNINGL